MKTFRKRISQGAMVIFCFIFILVGCQNDSGSKNSTASSAAAKEKVLKIASFGDFTMGDPAFNSVTYADSIVMESVYNGLVRFKPGSTKIEDIEADLAEKWESNKEGTIWTFHLRKGVKWQKGYGEFTSGDVKWSYERVMNPKTGSPASAYTNSIDKIETPDPYTVVFHLKKPDATFLLVLVASGNGPGKIVKKEAVEAAGAEFKFKPVGTGPFMVKEHKEKEKIVLEKNVDYFRGEPKLNLVEIYNMKEQPTVDIALDKGEIHIAPGIADTVWLASRQKNKDILVENSNHPIYWFIQLNTSMKPYDDIRVREAIAHAINSKEFIESVMGTQVANLPTSPLSSNLFGYANIGGYEYNPEKTKKLLADAGYPNGIKLPQNISSTTPTSLNKMTWIQEQLRKAGIEMPMNTVDPATALATYRKDSVGMILSAATVRAHADFLLTPYYHSKSMVGKPTVNNNYTHYDKADDLIDKGRQELDNEKAKAIYLQIQQQIKDAYVSIPLAETKIPLERRKEVNLGYDFAATPTTIYLINEKTDLEVK